MLCWILTALPQENSCFMKGGLLVQGKKNIIPYACWIAALAFDILIVINRYLIALIFFLLLAYSCYRFLQQKQTGIRGILIFLCKEMLLSFFCIILTSLLQLPLSPDQNTLLLFHPAACCISSVSAYLIHKTFKTMDHKLPEIVKYRYITESKAASRKKEAASQIHTLL